MPRLGFFVALALSWSDAAGHDADVFAVASGGYGVDPGDSVAVVEHVHLVDGPDDGGVVAQQDVGEPVAVVGGQGEGGGEVGFPSGLVKHTGISVFW